MRSHAWKVVGLLVAFVGVASAQSAVWKDYNSAEGRFSVVFPGSPTQSTQPTPTKLGNLATHMFTVTGSDAFYAVAYVDYPKDAIKDSKPDVLLDGAREGAVSKVKGTLIREDKITANGFPGRELKIEAPGDLIVYARIYMANERLFQAIAVTPKAKDGSPDLRKFLDSFKFTK